MSLMVFGFVISFAQNSDSSKVKVFKKNTISLDYDMYRQDKDEQYLYMPTLNYSRKFGLVKNGLYTSIGLGLSTKDFNKNWNFKGSFGLGWNKKWFYTEIGYQAYLQCFFGGSDPTAKKKKECYNTGSKACEPSDMWRLPTEYNSWLYVGVGAIIFKRMI